MGLPTVPDNPKATKKYTHPWSRRRDNLGDTELRQMAEHRRT
jgi:hypothetical protein